MKKNQYKPPYTITSSILNLVAEISESIGHYTALAKSLSTPKLRRENRIRSIQASLAIENNTLTLEQVTAVIAGKRVLGHPREIQEVRNAFAAYETMNDWKSTSKKHLLAAHGLLMSGLVDDAGSYRQGNVGIFRGKQLVHMAPPADRVNHPMDELLNWLKQTKEHPLITSCVFHYELEFIHPFADGNGRMGRLWQTLILQHWKPLLAYLPVETVIHHKQEDYYRVLAEADKLANSSPFVEFLLKSLQESLQNALRTGPVTDPVTDPVTQIIFVLRDKELGISELMATLHLSHRPTFRKNHLDPAIENGFIERTQPYSPHSPTQKYRLTKKGRTFCGLH